MVCKKNDKSELLDFSEDWSKIIHVDSSKLFVCGGSSKNEQGHILFSNKVCMIDVLTGEVTKLPDMIKERQAHGVVRIGKYVYCCGGLNQGWCTLDHCERFDLVKKRWTDDVPRFNSRKFSMTMVKVDRTWLYSFGGVSQNQLRNSRNLVVERLNT
jgi:hypothetical protein